ncbi:hypothetical protein COX86_03050 [Candidatus Micrarchaeota archaeon CG_4_10_14_0_2_um_filter_60_11]|nr:MAG: hypothetical protein COU39_00210 [Candidatus Micrarchaeota archaeon CG10_big_fil_rev_8_21_14_0_10_60_32]PIO02423.1 MAG: hypothetical protein COT58_00285 [Candidatus Micrarchaeota archaeon CG09_land_8_20_14_0_10_60_16]PIZ90795.1 MAG: hypothetical protein COX86_03050 [Candidatus Micrarchaeota archaeon CG_4_10_14_0_2_um_filter_60_11]
MALTKRGQAAVEYLAIVALSLAVLVPVWLYVDGQRTGVDGQLRLGYAQQAVDRIRDAADLVYAEGPPAQFAVEVNVPDGVLSASIAGKQVALLVDEPWGASEVYAATVANVTGSLDSFPSFGGPRTVIVKAERNYTDSFVSITEG